MGATASAQQESKRDEDEEQRAGENQVPEHSAEDELLQKDGQISSLNGKTEKQADEFNSQCEERALADVGSVFVTLKEDASDTTEGLQEGDASQASTENLSKQMSNTDDTTAKKENEANNKLNDTEIGFKKIFRFGGFQLTLKKDKADKIDADEPTTNEQDENAAGPSEDSWDTIDVSPVSRCESNEQDAEEIKNDAMRGDASAESPEADNEIAVGKISELTEHREELTPDKGLMKDFPQSPEPEEAMSPIKRFFSQGILASLRKKRKEEEAPKENEEELKRIDKEDEKESTKEDTTCICLNLSNITFEEDKDLQINKRDESKPSAEEELMNSQEQDKVQASPFKRLFRKLSTRRQRETKPVETNLIEPGENINENLQLSTELIKSQKEQETEGGEPQPAEEELIMDISHEESKKKSDSTVSWENLICGGSAKKRARKTSDSEDETQDKEVPRRTTESPLGSSTEGDYEHLTSSNEQGGSPSEEESGSTWKSFKKLVTPKRKGRMDESGSAEQIPSDTDISKDESSCSIRKLISGRKKIKSDGQQENISSDDVSKGTGTDIEDDETPVVVPLSEYEIIEPEILKVMTDRTLESTIEKEMHSMIEDDKPKQIKPFVKPSCNAGPSFVPILSDYVEELTEFINKHQQLSDIPEEGIIEESVATPLSFVEWTTQDDTIADDTVDMTADAVTAPEHATEEFNEDDTTEMVSAVSQLTESPKTSGNVTPVPPVYDMRESDAILQQVVESICMVPSVLSTTTKDKHPEALAVSVSPCIVESTTTTETKVLVTHDIEKATSIGIGLVSQKMAAAEVVLPLPLVEEISEITQAVPTELVFEDLPEESETAGMATDRVYEAEIKEITTEFHEVFSLDEQNTTLAETVRKSVQEILMDENIQDEVSCVEDVKDYSTEVLHVIQELPPVHAAVQGKTQLLEQVITKDINWPETEAFLEEPVQEQPAQNTEITVEGEKEHRLPDVESSATDGEQLDLVEVAEPALHNVVVSVPDSSLNEVSKITKDVVQVTLPEVVEIVKHDVVASGPDSTMNEASKKTEGMTGVLASTVECSETTEAISSVSPVSDYIKVKMELEDEVQMKNVPSLHFVDSHEIQMKVNNRELKTNAEEVLAVATAVVMADICENVEIIREGETAQQKTEPISAEKNGEIVAEKMVYNFEVENISEWELNILVNKSSLPVATTNEEKAVEEPEDMSKVMLGLEKEQTETDTILVEDCKRKQSTGVEIYMVTLNATETGEETKQPPFISEQPRLQEELTEDGSQPLTMDNTKPVSQPEQTFSKLIADTQTTDVAPESRKEESAIIEEVKRPRVGDECVMSDTLLEDMQKHKETAKPEVNSEIATEHQETVETVKSSPKVEPRLDTEHQQTEILPSNAEESQPTESSPKPYKENNQAAEGTVKMTETISAVTLIYAEETKQPKVISSTDEWPNEIEQICEGKSTICKPGEECNIYDQSVATVQCFEGVDRVTVTTMEGVIGIVPKSEAEDPEDFVTSEIEVHEQLLEVINVSTAQVSGEVESERKAEITVGSEQNIDSPDVTEQEVVSEMHVVKAAVSEKNIEIAAAFELKEETTMIYSEGQTPVSAEQVAESPMVTENKTETLAVTQTQVLTQVINELKAETLELTESKADIPAAAVVQVETAVVTELKIESAVVTSLVTELEVETPVVAKTLDTEILAVTSVINEAQSVLTSVKEPEVSTGTTLQEIPTVVSEIQTATVLSVVQTPAVLPIVKEAEMVVEASEEKDTKVMTSVAVEVTDTKLEMPVAVEAISQTSVVSELEVQTIVTLVLETETIVRTCVENNMEAQAAVVTNTVSELQLKTVTPVVQTPLVVQTATEVPAIQKPTDIPLIQEPEMPMVTQQIKETKFETPGAVEVTASKIETPVVKEIKVEAPVVTEQDVKASALKSVVTELEVTPVKNEVGSSVLTLIVEEPTVASLIKLPTVAPVVQTQTMVSAGEKPAVVQIPCVVPMVEILAVNTAVKEAEMPSAGPKVEERHLEAPDAIDIEPEVKVTETIEQVTQDVTANSKMDFESPEATSGRLKEVSVPMAKTAESLPEVDDDVWEDAVDDIEDDQCSTIKASVDMQDTTMCHGDK